MNEPKITGAAAREAVGSLHRLGEDESLSLGDRKVCLMASEWLAQVQDMRARLDAAEAFLNDELRRHEIALAKLSRRTPRPHGPLAGAELFAQLRRARQELEAVLPAAPTAIPFGVAPA